MNMTNKTTGRERAAARENAKRKAVEALYANTPNHPPSRQVQRKALRQAGKRRAKEY